MNKEAQQINWRDTNELIAMTAHDLRGIIARIYGLNLLVEEKLQGIEDKEAKKMTALIASQCKQGINLTEGLVDKYKSSMCSLTELLTGQIALYKYQTENKGIKLTTNIPYMDICIETRIVPLIRILDNLFDNALKFTSRDGCIKITLKQADSKVVISFTDTGIGIPPDFQPFLFEKSRKTQRLGTENEPSTGLGLYINKQLINELKGTIWFESLENIGTTFYVSLNLIDKVNEQNKFHSIN